MCRPALAMVAATVATFVVPSTALALQPIDVFLSGARSNHPDALASDATYRQREAEVGQARGRLLPSLTARGTYTHNQFEVRATLPGAGELVITPQNQVDALFLLDVPIVDLASFARYGAQKKQAELADAVRAQTRRVLEERVVRAYYLYAATAGLGQAADRTLELAEKNKKNVADRLEAGLVSQLDLERAIANVERAKQDVADVERIVSLGAREEARTAVTAGVKKGEKVVAAPPAELSNGAYLDLEP